MSKKDLIENLTAKTTLTKAQIKQVVDETFDFIADTISNGKKFQIIGFGTFHIRKRSGRTGTNPRTGEKIRIEAKTVPVFTPGKKLNQTVNRKK
jgi:DNA-binding protein HU-beta